MAVALVQLRRPAIFRPMPLKLGDSPRYIRYLPRPLYPRLLRKNGGYPRNSPRRSDVRFAGNSPSRFMVFARSHQVRFIDGKQMWCSLFTDRKTFRSRNGIRLVEETIGIQQKLCIFLQFTVFFKISFDFPMWLYYSAILWVLLAALRAWNYVYDG